MNWEQRLCINNACTAERWMIQRDPTAFEIWRVAAHVDDQPFIVAATVPVCPWCGTTLCLPTKQAHGIDEAGKVLESVKSSHWVVR